MDKLITAADFERKMHEILVSDNDNEKKHIQADELMCKALISLGYSAGVELFQEMPKWYS